MSRMIWDWDTWDKIWGVPAYKYDMLYNVLIENLNAITEEAELNLCGDETTRGHGRFGEASSGLIGQIINKPGVMKGV
jgi:hypothetical protein